MESGDVCVYVCVCVCVCVREISSVWRKVVVVCVCVCVCVVVVRMCGGGVCGVSACVWL